MVHVIISGDVQGVGFRQYIKYQAKKLDIKGWVKNLPASRPASPSLGGQGGPDGKVEALFIGKDENIEKMIEYCKKGPFLAQVKDVNIKEISNQDFLDFQIIK